MPMDCNFRIHSISTNDVLARVHQGPEEKVNNLEYVIMLMVDVIKARQHAIFGIIIHG